MQTRTLSAYKSCRPRRKLPDFYYNPTTVERLEFVRSSMAQCRQVKLRQDQSRRAKREKIFEDYLLFVETVRKDVDLKPIRLPPRDKKVENKQEVRDEVLRDQAEEAREDSPREENNLEIAQKEAPEEEPRFLRLDNGPSEEDKSNLASDDGTLVEAQNDEPSVESQQEQEEESLSQDPAEELKEEEAKQEASSDENSEQSDEEQAVQWSDKKFGLHLDLAHLTFLAESVMQPQNDEETTEEILRAIIEAISPLGRDDTSEEEDVEALFQPQDRQKLDISDRFSAGIKKLFQKFNTNN